MKMKYKINTKRGVKKNLLFVTINFHVRIRLTNERTNEERKKERKRKKKKEKKKIEESYI